MEDLREDINTVYSDFLETYINQNSLKSINELSIGEIASIELDTIKYCHEYGLNCKKSLSILIESVRSSLDI